MLNQKEQQMMDLLNEVLRLASQPDAPIQEMEPIEMITSAISMSIDFEDNPHSMLGTLVGTLAWIARHNWGSVCAAVRKANGETLH